MPEDDFKLFGARLTRSEQKALKENERSDDDKESKPDLKLFGARMTAREMKRASKSRSAKR